MNVCVTENANSTGSRKRKRGLLEPKEEREKVSSVYSQGRMSTQKEWSYSASDWQLPGVSFIYFSGVTW